MKIEDLQNIVQRAGQGAVDLADMRVFAKQASLMPSYLDAQHPMHREAVDAVEKCYELAWPEDLPSGDDAEAASALLESRLDLASPKERLTDYQRETILRNYGPPKGGDCPAWRESLPEHLQPFFQSEIGDPPDSDPIEPTTKQPGSFAEAVRQNL